MEDNLITTQKAHDSVSRELQDLLSEQQRLGARWKDESRFMSQHFESIVSNAQHKLSRAENLCKDLSQKCKELYDQKLLLQDQIHIEQNVRKINCT